MTKFTVRLNDEVTSTKRECEWLTEDGANYQANVWKEVFPNSNVTITQE